ncbi:MAG: MATE family efflux transporter, partial [Eubacteriales bacterium]
MKKDRFTQKMFYRFLFPSLVSSAALALGNIVDAVVVGTRMGEAGLAAISLMLPVYMVFNVFDIGISVGGCIEYAKLLGEGRAKAAKEHFNRMLQAALAVSILFAVLGNLFLPQILYILGATHTDTVLYGMSAAYARILITFAPLFFINFLMYYFIRNDDNQKLASIGFIAGNLLDFVLNYLFVILLNGGVEGAAWATVIGQATSIVIYLPHLFMKHNILGLQVVRPQFGEIFRSFRTGFATSNQ